MTSGAIAAMLSTILYGRRFFPYYVYNIIGGLDEQGRYFNAVNIMMSKCMNMHWIEGGGCCLGCCLYCASLYHSKFSIFILSKL